MSETAKNISRQVALLAAKNATGKNKMVGVERKSTPSNAIAADRNKPIPVQ